MAVASSGMTMIPATKKRISRRVSPPIGVDSGVAMAEPRTEAAGREVATSVIFHEDPRIAEGDGDADDEQHDANRRAEANAHTGDAEEIEERHHRVGRVQRPAAREADDHVEELQGADDREEHG